MKKITFSKKYIIMSVSLVVVIVLWYFMVGRDDLMDGVEMQPVVRGDVVEVVSETGFVQSSREVDLAFERGGRVESVLVNVGMSVEEGDILVGLNTASDRADLMVAYARLEAEQIRLNELVSGADVESLAVGESGVYSAEVTLQNAKEYLEKTIAQQNHLVINARKTLLSSGLEAYLIGEEREDSSYSYTAPTITGNYSSDDEGVYIIDLYNSASASGVSFYLSGLESGIEVVSTVNPRPLGGRGLFIQFPDNFARGSTVQWEVPIPNTRSSSYITNLNTYNAVVDASVVAIKTAGNSAKSAEAALQQTGYKFTQISGSARDERVGAQRALVKQMQAIVYASEVALSKMTLKAPFAGIVTEVIAEEDEIILPSEMVVTLIADDNYELVVNISESDIQEISIDDTAIVFFDAYNDRRFEAKVAHIAPSARVNEGVRAIEVTLQFVDKDNRICVGLSADIDILAAERHNVLVVPSRAVVETEDGRFVRTLESGGINYIPVQTGLRGSDGMTEIKSGLEEGQEIITFAHKDVIEALEIR